MTQATPIIGTVGRLAPQKGYEYLLRAVPQVLTQFPQAHFIIVGDGELREPLHQLAQDLDITNHVLLTGPRSDIEAIIASFDLFVNSSLWEGLPTVLMESMAARIPVIATTVAGNLELVIPEQTGILIPPALGGSALKSRVGEMIELCGLTVEQNKKIETLSKGYRQRVGLAQALIHNPKVLILDEPTTGLDPNQILEIRSLIKNISKNKTVIFSTHIMQEVSALCDRVIVINKGELVADDSLTNLMKLQGKNVSLVVEFEGEVNGEELNQIAGVEKVVRLDASKFRIYAAQGADVRPEVFRFAADRKLSLLGLKQEEGSLENIFRELSKIQLHIILPAQFKVRRLFTVGSRLGNQDFFDRFGLHIGLINPCFSHFRFG